jgi:pyrroline-5-carboxylate reductase
MDFSVVLVGAGNMGGAMLKGWLNNGLKPANIAVIDPDVSERFKSTFSKSRIWHAETPAGITPPDVLVLAIKPQMMAQVLPTLGDLIKENTVVVSVAAGTTLSTLTDAFGDVAAIRVMPNTPSLVLRGMSVGCANSLTSEIQRENVNSLMNAVGKIEWVDDEKLIDAVTAVSGSGPAYVFHLAECMAQAGVKAGLPEELAMTLAVQTVSGAGELLLMSDDEPETLRKNVTSPNGTTAAALEVLMGEGGMSELLAKAIMAAKKRSEELS